MLVPGVQRGYACVCVDFAAVSGTSEDWGAGAAGWEGWKTKFLTMSCSLVGYWNNSGGRLT